MGALLAFLGGEDEDEEEEEEEEWPLSLEPMKPRRGGCCVCGGGGVCFWGGCRVQRAVSGMLLCLGGGAGRRGSVRGGGGRGGGERSFPPALPGTAVAAAAAGSTGDPLDGPAGSFSARWACRKRGLTKQSAPVDWDGARGRGVAEGVLSGGGGGGGGGRLSWTLPGTAARDREPELFRRALRGESQNPVRDQDGRKSQHTLTHSNRNYAAIASSPDTSICMTECQKKESRHS